MNGCEVADDPVVVMKFWPVKAGNSVEDKTRTMISQVLSAAISQKQIVDAKG